MPPWLLELLQHYNSKGYVDTLAALVGQHPKYQMIPDQRMQGGMLGAGFSMDKDGNPVINITPNTTKNFSNVGAKNYPGYQAVDKNQQLGDQTIGHEFGHMAMYGAGGNASLADALSKIMSLDDEKGMDDFQQATQFLRKPDGDISKLSPKQQLITNVLLQQDIYKQHPINQRRVLEKVLAQLIQPQSK